MLFKRNKKPGRKIFLIAGFALITVSFSLAQSADSPDFSAAFKGLRSLGLPDSKDATYITLAPGGENASYYGARMYAPFANDLYNLKLKGNAWLVEENKEAKTFSVILFNHELSTFSTDAANKETPIATWKKADAKADLSAILKYLDEDERVSDMIGYSDDVDSKLLLAAAQFHRFGLAKDANLFAAKTLEMVKNKNDSVTKIISALANQEYNEALKQVPQTGNWKAFADTCTIIARKFGRGWNAAQAVSEIADKARKQPASPPPLPALPGMPLTKEHQSIAAEISKIRKAPVNLEHIPNAPWVLFSEEQLDHFSPPSEKDEDKLFRRIVSGSMDSVPMLLAMLGDETFLSFPLSSQSGNEIARILASTSGEDEINIPMPTSRSGFAAIFLTGLIPGFEPYNSDMDDIRGASLDWYERAKEMSLAEIAREYLHSGTSQQTQIATVFLGNHGNEDDFATMEEEFIAQAIESPWSMSQQIPAYVKKRGPAGLSFIKRLEKEIQKHLIVLKDDTENKDEYENQKKAYEQQLKQLHGLTSTETAADILARVVAGEEDLDEIQSVFYQKLMDDEMPDRIKTLLGGINETDDPKLRAEILQYFSYLNRNGKAQIPPISQQAENWKSILADTRKIEDETELRLSAAYAIENLYGADEAEELGNFWNSTGAIGGPFLIKRASARVAGKVGKDLPKCPKAEDVTEDRRTTLTSELLALAEKPDALRTRLNALTLAEKIWAVGKRFDPEDNSHKTTPLEDAISKVQNTIKEVKAPQGWSGFDAWSGTTFSQEKFDHLIKQALARLEGGETFEMEMKASGPFGPLTVSISPTTMKKLTAEKSPAAQSVQQWEEIAEEKASFLAASSGGGYYGTFWFVGADESDTEAEELGSDRFSRMRPQMKEGQKTFRNNLRHWLQPSLAMTNPMDFKFFGVTIEPQTESEDDKEK